MDFLAAGGVLPDLAAAALLVAAKLAMWMWIRARMGAGAPPSLPAGKPLGTAADAGRGRASVAVLVASTVPLAQQALALQVARQHAAAIRTGRDAVQAACAWFVGEAGASRLSRVGLRVLDAVGVIDRHAKRAHWPEAHQQEAVAAIAQFVAAVAMAATGSQPLLPGQAAVSTAASPELAATRLREAVRALVRAAVFLRTGSLAALAEAHVRTEAVALDAQAIIAALGDLGELQAA